MALSTPNLETRISIGVLADWKYHWWTIEVNGFKADVPPSVLARVVAAEAMFLQELKIIYDYPTALFDQIKATPKRIEFVAAISAYRQRYMERELQEFKARLEADLNSHGITDSVNRFHI